MYKLVLSQMIRRLLTGCMALSIIYVSAVQAISMSTSPSGLGRYYNYDKTLQDNGPLQRVVRLLEAGRRDEAKIQLARILTRNPRDVRALGLAGMFLLEDKKYFDAETSFRRALTIQPVNDGLLSKLGVSLLLQGKLNQGETELRKALAVNKQEPLALRYMGWLAQTRGNLDVASDYYLRFIQSRGAHANDLSRIHLQLAIINNDAARYQSTVDLIGKLLDKKLPNNLQRALAVALTEAYAELKEVKQARKWLRRLETHKDVNKIELVMLEARILRQENKQKQAINILQTVIAMDPEYEPVIRFMLVQTYIGTGDRERAFKELEALSRLVEKDNLVQIVYQMARLKLQMNDQTGAIKVLEDAINKNPGLPIIKYQLAELLLVMKQPRQALETSLQITRSHPSFTQAYLLAGRLERAYKNYDKAEALLKKAITLFSGYYEAWIELAGIYVDNKDYDRAISVLKRGLALNPGHVTMMFEMATIYQEASSNSKAEATYRKILDAVPDNIESLNNLALILLETATGKKEALTLARRAYDISKHPAIIDTYAWALVNNGKARTAIPLLQKLLKETPDDASVNYHLGVAMIKVGQTKDGRSHLQKALKSGIDNVSNEKIQAYLNR